jgi:hypothetical protein
MDKDTAMRGAFMKLFEYISGANSQKAKIPMTAPVLTAINPGDGPNCESTFTMSFYNPYTYQVSVGGQAAALLGVQGCIQVATCPATVAMWPDGCCSCIS